MGGAVGRGGPGGPDLQRGLPEVRGPAVRAVRGERRLRAAAGRPDGENGDRGQSPPQHQLHVLRGGLEQRVGAAAQQEVLHAGQRVHKSAG